MIALRSSFALFLVVALGVVNAHRDHHHHHHDHGDDGGDFHHHHHHHDDGDRPVRDGNLRTHKFIHDPHHHHHMPFHVQDDSTCKCENPFVRPKVFAKEETARWMLSSLTWGILSTVSSRVGTTADGRLVDKTKTSEKLDPAPFGNIFSIADAPCGETSSNIYIYGTFMDQSFKDWSVNSNDAVSLTLSDANLDANCLAGSDSSLLKTCSSNPMNPPCARVVFTGKMQLLEDESGIQAARDALFSKHPDMKNWPKDHGFVAAKLDVQDIWFIDFYGGASILDIEKFQKAELTKKSPSDTDES